MKRFRLTSLFFVLSNGIIAQTLLPGQTYFSANGYIEYRVGNLPFILSAPHGGDLKPANIPDRTCNNPTTVLDLNTEELAKEIDTTFMNRTGCRPHIVICHLSRLKMDANRDLADGACGNTDAEEAWKAFHNWLDSARAKVTAATGKGFYIDLHAHGHTLQQLELGYLLTATELQKTDAQLLSGSYKDSSSIRNLCSNNLHGYTFPELLRGPYALGTMLAAQGFPSVPSAQKPAPATGEPYFNGGYNTAYYTSYMGGNIDGVQIESNYTGVRNTRAIRKAFADSLTITMLAYLRHHYFGNAWVPSCMPNSITQSAKTVENASIFPNPSGGNFSLRCKGRSGYAVVLNAQGMLIERLQIDNGKAESNKQLAAGVYTIVVYEAGAIPVCLTLVVN